MAILEQKENKEYNYCIVCGKRLKTQNTRLYGMGDTCRKKLESGQKNKLKIF